MANPVYTINVADYGVVGDGVTDDLAAINRALAACPGGGTVVFPARTVLTTGQITIPRDDITLSGYGCVITSASDTQFRKFLFSGRTRGAVLGFRFECLWTSATNDIGEGVIEINASSDITIRDCTFNEVAESGVYVVGASPRCHIIDNRFYKNFCAIFTDDDTTTQPTQLQITGNSFRTGLGTTSTAFSAAIKISGVGSVNSLAGHVISNNIIDTPGEMGIEIQTWVNGCTINGNIITGAGFGISISGCSDTTVTSNTLKACVSYGFESASTCTNLTFANNTIIGKNTAGTIVTGLGAIIGSTTTAAVTGNVITGCTNSLRLDGSSYVSITGGSITFSTGTALNIKNSSYVNVEGVLFSGLTSTGEYFVFVDSTDSAVSSILISGNTLTGVVTSNGILLYTPANSIQNVTIVDNITLGSFASGQMYGYTVSGSGSLAAIRVLRNTGPAGGSFTTWLNVPVYPTTSTETLDPKTETVLVDATGGAKTITLPTAVGISGKVYTIQKSDSSGNAVTVGTTSSQGIDGSTTQSLASQYKRITVQSNGADWVILQSN